MHQPDFEDFRQVLNRCAEVFGKPQPTDVIVQAYWRALKDVALSTVQARADEHCKRGKFFPKPYELRPRDDRPAAAPPDKQFTEAQALGGRHLDALRTECGEERWKRHVWICRLDRILVTEHPSSPIYVEALRESRILRPLVRGY